MLFAKKSEPTPLQTAIDEMLRELMTVDGASPEAERIVTRLTDLHKMQETSSSDRLSKDVAVSAATNLAGILLILNHERAHVVTSKALGFVAKLR